MSEAVLFIIVGLIAVAAAVAMLVSENPVHSALFLIVNFACVAFFYVMLDAPFLAMIQIAVYTGAIMVLFLFVIMLLGAEKLTEPTKRFPWLAPVGVGLSAAFVLIVGVALLQGQIDLTHPTDHQPMLRVVHAAPYAGPVDVYVNNQLVATNLEFGAASNFQTLPPGNYVVDLDATGTTTSVAETAVQLTGSSDRQANSYNLIAYGGSASAPPQFSPLVYADLESVDDRTARISIFNAEDQTISLIDYGSANDTTDDKKVTDVLPGTMTELPLVPETTSMRSWGFTANGQLLTKLDNSNVFNVKRDTSQLLVVTQENSASGGIRPIAVPIVNDAVPSFGGPAAIGQLLFSSYMLPFQLIAVLLLAAMIGAIVLTHKEEFVPRRRDVRRRVMKPLTDVIGDQVGHEVAGQVEADAPQLAEHQPEAAGD